MARAAHLARARSSSAARRPGSTDEERALLDGAVTIEMAGRAESLNVGVAAALLCFEALRRRAGPVDGDATAPTI